MSEELNVSVYLILINFSSCMDFKLGGALQLSLWFAHADPIPSSLKYSGRARAFAPFDAREAGSEQQGGLPLDTKPVSD